MQRIEIQTHDEVETEELKKEFDLNNIDYDFDGYMRYMIPDEDSPRAFQIMDKMGIDYYII